MWTSKVVIFCSLFAAIYSIPVPQREVNEEDTDKFFRPTDALKRTTDPKRADAADWMRIADEDMKKADEMFGAKRPSPTPEVAPVDQQPLEAVQPQIGHKDEAVAPPNEVVVEAPNSNSSPAQSESPQQQLPEGDPVEQEDPDHLPAVPIEGDGTLNAEYKSEILLGPEHSHAHNSPEEQRELLKDVFKRIDNNTDGYVDTDELAQWFLINVRRHMAAAQADGESEFKRLDANKDNKLEWHEYETAHLRAALAAGKKEELVTKKVASSRVNAAHGEMEGHEDHLTALRLRWMRADENGDDKLSLSEFSSFHHPEQHPSQLEALSKQLMASFDLDRDGKIAAWEFEAHTDVLPEEIRVKGPGSVMQYTNDLITERKHQFQLADVDGDGYLTLDEVKQFLDPQNIQHAKHEAEDIIHLADVDEDGMLTLEEMLEKVAELMGPGHRLCDPAETLHHDMDEL